MRKLGFLGAMNRDVVVEQAAAHLLPQLGLDAPSLIETPVSDADAQRGVDLVAGRGAVTWLGGSAFNVARIAALLNQDATLDLAFFGIAGSVHGAHPHLAALSDWSIATSSVMRSPLLPATCLALVEPAGRTLLTALGANVGIADWLVQNRNDLVTAIAGQDIIHVTSFLDPAAPGLIAEILASARAINPGLVVSLDPGMAWIAPGGDGLAALMRQTSILHLNAEEFAALGGCNAVPTIGLQLAPDWLIVARTHTGATLYADSSDVSLPGAPLGTDVKVIDPNGAGDTFCGGFLWAYAHNPTQPLKAAELGFVLARHKVGLSGPLTRQEARKAMLGVKSW